MAYTRAYGGGNTPVSRLWEKSNSRSCLITGTKEQPLNPDIYLSSDGQIEIVSTQFKGKLFVTDLNIADFLP